MSYDRQVSRALDDEYRANVALFERVEHALANASHADAELARRAAEGNLDTAGFAARKRHALEMIERQVAYIQKETMALLPMLDDVLDDDDDRALAFACAAD